MRNIFFIILFSIFAIASAQDTLKVGDEAPSFSLPNLNNNYIFLSDFSGEKLRKPWKNTTKHVVVISFFATWCEPCKREIPYLEKLKEKYKGQPVKFFLIDVGEEREKIDAFLKKNPVKLDILLDRYQQVSEKYGATSLPRLFVLDKNAKIILIKKGFSDGENFLKELNKIISTALKS